MIVKNCKEDLVEGKRNEEAEDTTNKEYRVGNCERGLESK